ncbi:MAG: hypothetical protein V1668_01830 [Patescibacteria group bacterium]
MLFLYRKWHKWNVAALVLVCLYAWLGGCSSRNEDTAIAQKKLEWEQQYQAKIEDLEKNFRQKPYQAACLDSLRFLRTVCLGQSFAPDSARIDSLVCLSQSYQTQMKWDMLRQLDLSEFDNVRWIAPGLIREIMEEMQSNGCLFGNIEPTIDQLKIYTDSCFLYELKHSYRQALEDSRTTSVDRIGNYLLENDDSIPGLLAWIGTTREDLQSLVIRGYRGGAVNYLQSAYTGSGIGWVDEWPIFESNRCRTAIGWSLEELAKRTDVPIGWIRWAYQKNGIKPDSAG